MAVPEAKNGVWRIGEIATKLGVTTKTLRHYELMGLMRPPQRTSRHYRIYDDTDFERARLTVELRRLGLSLEEIRGLLNDTKSGLKRRQRLLGVLDQKVREIDETLAVLQGQRDDLAARTISLLTTPPDTDGDCICAALDAGSSRKTCACCDREQRPDELTVEGLLKAASRAGSR